MFTRPSLALIALAASAWAQQETSMSGSTATESLRTTSPATRSADLSSAVTGLIFLENNEPVEGFDASLICADSSETTYVLRCATTDSTGGLCRTLRDAEITVTANPSSYNFIYTTQVNGGRGTVTQTCDFGGPSVSATSATVSLSAWIAAGGRSVALTSALETLGTEGFPPVATIPVAAGGDNANAESCPTASTAPTSSVSRVGGGGEAPSPTVTAGMSSSDASDSVAREVYKLLVPVGVAAAALAGM